MCRFGYRLGSLGWATRKHVLDEGAHWRHLANMTESFMCGGGGDTASLSNYFDHLYTVVSD